MMGCSACSLQYIGVWYGTVLVGSFGVGDGMDNHPSEFLQERCGIFGHFPYITFLFLLPFFPPPAMMTGGLCFRVWNVGYTHNAARTQAAQQQGALHIAPFSFLSSAFLQSCVVYRCIWVRVC